MLALRAIAGPVTGGVVVLLGALLVRGVDIID